MYRIDLVKQEFQGPVPGCAITKETSLLCSCCHASKLLSAANLSSHSDDGLRFAQSFANYFSEFFFLLWNSLPKLM